MSILFINFFKYFYSYLNTTKLYGIIDSGGDYLIDIKNEIKSYIALSGWTLTDIVKAMNEKYGTDTTTQNLSNKLTRGTIKYSECKQIAEIIGYEIKWNKKD